MVRHGKTGPALETLAWCVDEGVIPPYDWLMLAPYMGPLRQDSRSQNILEPSKAQYDEMLVILNDARARGEFPAYLEKPLEDLLEQLAEAEKSMKKPIEDAA